MLRNASVRKFAMSTTRLVQLKKCSPGGKQQQPTDDTDDTDDLLLLILLILIIHPQLGIPNWGSLIGDPQLGIPNWGSPIWDP